LLIFCPYQDSRLLLNCKVFGVLVDSGDHDIQVPYLGTQAWIRSLNYSIIDDWRPWMIKDQIAGYIRFFFFKTGSLILLFYEIRFEVYS